MSPPLMIVVIVQLLSWLVICVPRVACDFVSRLGGWDAIFFFIKGRLIEPFLGGPLFCGCGDQVVDMDTLSLCLRRMVPASGSTHVVL